jgi:hypothetical protein
MMIFLFDENFSDKYSQALNLLEEADRKTTFKIKVKHIRDYNMMGAPDEKVIEQAGKLKATIFTMDNDFKKIKHYYPLYKEHKVGVVFFKSYTKGQTYWKTVLLLIQNWELLKNKISNSERPFAFEVDKTGIKPLSF